MQQVFSLPELPARTQPPSKTAPNAVKSKRSFGIGSSFKSGSAVFDAEPLRVRPVDREPQRQRMGAPRGKVVRSMVPSEPLSEQQRVQDEQWLQDEQRAQDLLRIKPKEAARSPGRKRLAFDSTPPPPRTSSKVSADRSWGSSCGWPPRWATRSRPRP